MLSACLVLNGCDDDDAAADQLTLSGMIERFDNASAIVAGQATPTTHATPDDWIGWELGLTPAESTPIGSVEISANAPAFPVIPDSEDSEALDFADPLQEVSPSPAELQGTLEWIEVDELGNAHDDRSDGFRAFHDDHYRGLRADLHARVPGV